MVIRPEEGFDKAPVEIRLKIDEVCSRFESAWRSGESPSLDDYFDNSVVGAYRNIFFAELLAIDVEYRRRAGQQAAAADYVDRFPSLRPVVESVFRSPMDGEQGETLANDDTVEQDERSQNKSAPLPKIDGYDVICELGKGGMGIVFKALDLKLNRTVAIKMILDSDFASSEEMLRFLIEGETLARLDHPNIVHVFDVNQAHNRPYLALEYIEGQTLAEYLQTKSPTANESARLVEELARATHYAHLRGVVHRDLKPANVLLQDAGSPQGSLSAAKIADFGLARSTEPGTGITSTGLIMGTPGFMAPEQARGEKNVGPAADVYSLGAMLFQVLTGRPPFQAKTPLETLHMVSEQPPPRPSQLRADVPRDLDTICLKCLNKEPADRYASAFDLAEDLRRWREDKPIRGRPVGPVERGWKWSKRNPALAGLLATVAVLLVGISLISTIAAVRLSRQQTQTHEAQRRRQKAIVESVLTASASAVPVLLEELTSERATAIPLFRETLQTPGSAALHRLRSAVALTALGDSHAEHVLNSISSAPDQECGNIVLALRQVIDDRVLDGMRERAATAPDLGERVRCAIVLLELGEVEAASNLLVAASDPSPRSAFIERYQTWHGDLSSLPEVLRQCENGETQSGLCAAIGRISAAELAPTVREEVTAVLTDLFEVAPDPGTHAAADWALRQWDVTIPRIPPSNEDAAGESDPSGRRWFINDVGMTMVRIEPAVVSFAPNAVAILNSPYFIGDREVSISVFRRFLNDPEYPDSEKPKRVGGQKTAPAQCEECPMNEVSIKAVLLFCNWLSVRDGRSPCYQLLTKRWYCDFSADGYRLPTDAEWYRANTCESTTRFFFGNDPRWLRLYAHIAMLEPTRGASKLPNQWGLFDTLGNVWESCWVTGGEGVCMEPIGSREMSFSTQGPGWSARGGGFDSGTYNCVSDFRLSYTARRDSYGFRVVCRAHGAHRDGEHPTEQSIEHQIDVLSQAIDRSPDNILLRRVRANLYGRSGDWRAAQADFSKCLEVEPMDLKDAYQSTALFVQNNDHNGYRTHCRRMLEQFGATTDPRVAEWVSKSCALGPVLVEDFNTVTALADFAVSAENHPLRFFFRAARGMVAYRNGEFEKAVGWLRRSLEGGGSYLNEATRCTATMFLAMSQYKVGDRENAQATMDSVENQVRSLLADDQDFESRWNDYLMTRVVYREARRLFESADEGSSNNK